MLKKLLEPLLFRKMEKAIGLYKAEEFDRILRLYDRPIKSSQLSDVFRNILRICSLVKQKDDVWQGEYLASLTSGEFDNFLDLDSKKYIQFYIYSQLDTAESSAEVHLTFKMDNVSDRMKRYFPLNVDQLKFLNIILHKAELEQPFYIAVDEPKSTINLF